MGLEPIIFCVKSVFEVMAVASIHEGVSPEVNSSVLKIAVGRSEQQKIKTTKNLAILIHL